MDASWPEQRSLFDDSIGTLLAFYLVGSWFGVWRRDGNERVM
jgi:hypothetical protein